MFSLTEVVCHSFLPDNKVKVRSQNINKFKNQSPVLFVLNLSEMLVAFPVAIQEGFGGRAFCC